MQFAVLMIGLLAVAVSPVQAQQGSLDTTNFIVLGEGLAAGLSDLTLKAHHQQHSFVAQIAKQMQTNFPMPLMEVPGIGGAPGFQALAANMPLPLQTSLREPDPNLFVFNLSVPGFRLSDSLTVRPVPPLVQNNDLKQTVANLILGFPALLLEKAPLWTQLEYARQMRPTFVLVELGYYDVVDAAASNDLGRLPDVAAFRGDYGRLLDGLNSTYADVLVTTVPDPMDTAYYTSLEKAERLIGAPASVLQALYKLKPDDLLSPNALMLIGGQLLSRSVGPLPAETVLSAANAAAISSRVNALNSEIRSVAQQKGARVYDLYAFLRSVKTGGIAAGAQTLTADYMGGFYCINGFYPGITGHALIANSVLTEVNKSFGTAIPLVDVAAVQTDDTVPKAAPRPVRMYSIEELEKFIPNLRELMAPPQTEWAPSSGRTDEKGEVDD